MSALKSAGGLHLEAQRMRRSLGASENMLWGHLSQIQGFRFDLLSCTPQGISLMAADACAPAIFLLGFWTILLRASAFQACFS